jgi:hypothetical protein
MGPPASVHVDIDGESIWAFIRCDETSPVPVARGGRFGVDCMLPDGKLKPHDTIYKFDSRGNVVKSFGAGMFIWPHGLHVDREGNVWATDAAAEDAVATATKAGVKAGHFVRKFSPDGQVLMTLGEPGVAGNDESHFRSPAAVVTAPNGDIFIADGHGSMENSSRPGARPATHRASSGPHTASIWTSEAGCSCAIGRMPGSRSSTRMGNFWPGGTNSGCRAGSPSRSTTKT